MSTLATYTVGGRQYPVVRSPRCRTCRSAHRLTVEVAVVGGASASEAVQHLPEDARLTARNVREHLRRGHLPVEHEVVARMIEQEARARADLIETGATDRCQALAMATVVVEMVTAGLMEGELEPTIRDGIQMARLLVRHDEAVRQDRRLIDQRRREDQKMVEQLHRSGEALTAVLVLVKRLMAPAAWSALLVAMHGDDLLRPWIPAPR